MHLFRGMGVLLACVGLLGLTGCDRDEPELVFEPSTLNFGAQNLSRPPTTLPGAPLAWTLRNVSNTVIKLGPITSEALGLSAPFSVVEGGSCVEGKELVADESCTISVAFVPSEAGKVNQEAVVQYAKQNDEGGYGRYREEIGEVEGEGELNCSYEPDHPICGEDPDLVYSASPLAFGNVDLFSSKTLTVTVRNQDADESVTLGTIDNMTLGLPESYVLDAFQTTCATGMVLEPVVGTCVVAIKFQPQFDAYISATLNIPFVEQHQMNIAEKAPLLLQGTGKLNCSVTPELTQSRAEGVTVAQAKNEQETAAGTAAGNALTYGDGRTDGYNQTYQSSYNAAYDAAYDTAYDSAYTSAYNNAYNSAYNNTYDSRYDELVNDSSICYRGHTWGNSDGASDGNTDGKADGYDDGYDDYYPSGYSIGYDYGYDDGYYSCDVGYSQAYRPHSSERSAQKSREVSFAGIGQALISPTDPQFGTACYQQGYNATYNPRSYQNAYEAARAANVDYQNGLRDGRAQGTTAGTNAGRTQGQTNGNAEGTSQGRARGTSDGIARGTRDAEAAAQPVIDRIYTGCYIDAYESAYLRNYESSYSYYYVIGGDAGYDDGYYDGYDDGYYYGESDGCGYYSNVREKLASRNPTSSRRKLLLNARVQHRTKAPRWLDQVLGAGTSAALTESRMFDGEADIHERMRTSMRQRAKRVR